MKNGVGEEVFNDKIFLVNFAFNRTLGLPICSLLLKEENQYNKGVLFLLFYDSIENHSGIILMLW